MNATTPSEAFQDLIDSEPAPKIKESVTELPETVKEAFDTTTTALAPTALERGILENAVQGISVAASAYHLGIPESHIRTFIRDPKVKLYLKELREAIVEIDQLMLAGTLRKVMDARIDKLEEDEDFSTLTKKDTLDVIKVFIDHNNNLIKSQTEDKTNDVFVSIYQQIMEK